MVVVLINTLCYLFNKRQQLLAIRSTFLSWCQPNDSTKLIFLDISSYTDTQKLNIVHTYLLISRETNFIFGHTTFDIPCTIIEF